MSLIDVELEVRWHPLPADVAALLHEVESRVGQYSVSVPRSYRGYIPCDHVAVYHALRTISEANLARGDLFCEWGCGLGVVASLAAMLGFQAHGIEINGDLVEASRQLTGEFGIDIALAHGSFVPEGAEELVDEAFVDNEGQFSLDTTADGTYEEMGWEIADFDLIFAFPWPHDEQFTRSLFEHFASDGALLLTYGEPDIICLQRKQGS